MKKSQLKSGVVLSYLNLLLGNLIPFFYTPVMLSLMGREENGLYGIANSVMGYIGLLNFGIGNAVIRYLSKYRAEGDFESERRVMGLFLKVYSVLAGIILAVGFVVSLHLDAYGRSLSAEELDKLRILVRLMALNMAVFLPFSVYSSVIIAHEHYIFNRLINIFATVAAPCLNLLVLYAGFGSVGLVATSTVVNFFSYGMYTLYARKKVNVKPLFTGRVPGLLREILTFSAFAFLGSLVDVFYWATDKLIIGWAIGTAAVSVYNIGASFNGYLTGLSTAVSSVLTPRITSILAQTKDVGVLSGLFIRVGRLQFLIISLILSGFLIFGKTFLELWVGPGFEEAYPVALLTMIPVTVPLIQNAGLNILYVMNRHQFRSVVYLCIALANVGLSVVWVKEYGIVGAAAATGISYVVGNIGIMNWYYYKRIGLNIPKFWREIGRMTPQVVVFTGIGLSIVPRLKLESWGHLILAAAVYTALYVPAAYVWMMNPYERGLLRQGWNKVRATLRRTSRADERQLKNGG